MNFDQIGFSLDTFGLLLACKVATKCKHYADEDKGNVNQYKLAESIETSIVSSRSKYSWSVEILHQFITLSSLQCASKGCSLIRRSLFQISIMIRLNKLEAWCLIAWIKERRGKCLKCWSRVLQSAIRLQINYVAFSNQGQPPSRNAFLSALSREFVTLFTSWNEGTSSG